MFGVLRIEWSSFFVCRVKCLGCMVQDLEFRVTGLGFWAQSLTFRIQNFGFRIQCSGSGFGVQGFWFTV